MRTAAVVLALALCGTAALAQAPALTVTYRSETSVYVSGGRAQGLAVGERLTVVDGKQVVGELEVVYVAESSASCRVVRQSRPLKPGDRVERAAGAARATPAPAGSPTAPVVEDAVTSPRPAPAVRPTPSPSERPFAQASGSASAGVATSFTAKDGTGRTTEQYGRFDLSLRDLGGSAASFRARGSTRNVSREGRGFAVPLDERRDRLHEAALVWQKPRLVAQVGRLGAAPFVSLGYLDGVLAELRPAGSLHVGGFFGRDPNVERIPGWDGGSRLGGFVRFAPQGVRLPYEVVVSGVREDAADEVSREYVGVEAQVRSGRMWLYGRSEIDLNRGWREERAESATQLSDLRVNAAWQLSATHSFSLTYDRHENFWSRANRDLPEWMLDPAARQGFSAAWRSTPAQGFGVHAGGNVRLREGDDRRSWAAYAGVRHPRFFGTVAGLEGSWSESAFHRGLMATARVGRDVRGGHRLDLSYTMNRYELVAADQPSRTSQWVRLSGYGQFGRGGFAQGDLEYAMGDDVKGPRILAEVGWRF